ALVEDAPSFRGRVVRVRPHDAGAPTAELLDRLQLGILRNHERQPAAEIGNRERDLLAALGSDGDHRDDEIDLARNQGLESLAPRHLAQLEAVGSAQDATRDGARQLELESSLLKMRRIPV